MDMLHSTQLQLEEETSLLVEVLAKREFSNHHLDLLLVPVSN